jgi:predicted CoA-binding protein
MNDDYCPIPPQTSREERKMIEHMLEGHSIAVVGMSDDPSRPSHYVGQYLLDNGYDIQPVNPMHGQVAGRTCVASLRELRAAPDVVLVFRRSQFCGDVARQAIEIGARGVWLQSGIRSEEARLAAEAAGIDFVQDRCMMVEHSMRAQRATL